MRWVEYETLWHERSRSALICAPYCSQNWYYFIVTAWSHPAHPIPPRVRQICSSFVLYFRTAACLMSAHTPAAQKPNSWKSMLPLMVYQ